MAFFSAYSPLCSVAFPEFGGTRVMMMPIVLGDAATVAGEAAPYAAAVGRIVDSCERLRGYRGRVGYLTIDEQDLPAGRSQRRPGPHVDGVYRAGAGGWGGGGSWGGGGAWGGGGRGGGGGAWGGGGGAWGGGRRGADVGPDEVLDVSRQGAGFVVASSYPLCRAWFGEVRGEAGDEGECEHLQDSLDRLEPETLVAYQAYWMAPLCVHESLPADRPVRRQLVRVSLPSEAPWFEGYTPSPVGVQPTGPILPARTEFMSHG